MNLSSDHQCVDPFFKLLYLTDIEAIRIEGVSR